MPGLKKIDYRELLKKNVDADSEGVQQDEREISTGQSKKFSLSRLKLFWSTADKKVKIELIIFILILLAVITVFSIYFKR